MLVFEPCKMILFVLFMYNIEKVHVTKNIILYSATFSCHALNIAENKVEQRFAAIFSAD